MARQGCASLNREHVAAPDFKAHRLKLLDEVARRRRPIIVTKRGKPIAKLVPVEKDPIDIYGRVAGTVTICGDIAGPIEDLEWTGDADNI